MGVDLHLLILKRPEDISKDLIWNYDHLIFERDSEIFAQFSKLKGKEPSIESYPISPRTKVEVKKDKAIKEIRKDEYGQILKYVYAKQLKKGLTIHEDTNDRNKAIMAFIKKLPAETPIILYWK